MRSPKGCRPLFERLKTGLEEAVLHAKGEITLKTSTRELPDRPPEVGAEELTSLRLDGGMSQAVFARLLNVSTKTVQSWEQGVRKPSQAALRLLQVYRQKPSGLLEVVGMSGRKRDRSVGKRRRRKPARNDCTDPGPETKETRGANHVSWVAESGWLLTRLDVKTENRP